MWYTLYMADKVPVQDELSKRLAELIWCFAGTEEEDEYAGQVYLDLDEGEREDFGSGGAALGAGDGEDGDEGGDDDENEDDDDSYEVHMEEIVNTLESSDDEDENENENEDEADEIDDALQKHCRGAHLASLYVRTFFRTMRREWGNADKHRIDKFYTAMRLVLAEVYKYMAKRHWNLGIIRLFNDTLFEEVLSQVPNGLRYHLIDITIAELAKANRDAELPLTEATFLDCLEPHFALAQSAEDKIVQKRIVDNVLTKFLMEFSVVSDNAVEADDDDSSEAGELIFREVHVGSVAKLIFEMASDGETDDRYRAGLYELHKMYQRRIAAIGRDVDLEDGSDGDDNDEAYGALMPDEDEEDEEEDVPEPPKSKSKKNKKGKTAEATPKSKPSSSKKKDKSRNKNSKKSDAADNDENDVDENVTSQVVDPADFITPKKKTKKEKKSSKKKKSKADAAAEETGAAGSDEEDEVVNISVKEQKKAAKASAKKTKSNSEKKSKKKERKLSIEEQEEEERRKSVSFGAINHSKSYKASMKDLKRRDLPSTAVMTPDKSILHKRNVQSADGKSKKDGKGKRVRGGAPATEPRKRRAVDYF